MRCEAKPILFYRWRETFSSEKWLFGKFWKLIVWLSRENLSPGTWKFRRKMEEKRGFFINLDERFFVVFAFDFEVICCHGWNVLASIFLYWMYWYTWACNGIQGRACISIHGHALVCIGIRWHVLACIGGIYRFVQVYNCRYWQELASIYRFALACIGMYWSVLIGNVLACIGKWLMLLTFLSVMPVIHYLHIRRMRFEPQTSTGQIST